MKTRDVDGEEHRLIACFDGLLVFALSYAYLSLLPKCFDVFDEGLLASTSERLYQGEVLYRDVFSYWNPGSFWLCEALFGIAGVSVQTLRVSLTLFAAAATVGIWRLARDHAGRSAAILAALAVPTLCYPIWWMTSPHWYTTFVSIGAALALSRSIGTRHTLLAVLTTGVLCGATFVFLQPAGAFLCAVVGGVLAWDTAWFESKAAAVKRVGVLALGALVPIVSMYAYFAVKGSLGAMVTDTILWNAMHYSPSLKAAYGSISVLIQADPSYEATRVVLMVLPPLVIAAAFALTISKYLGRNALNDDRRLFALAATGAGFLGGNYYYPDMIHLAFAAAPAFALLAALGSRFSRAYGLRSLTSALAIASLAFVVFTGVESLQRNRSLCSASLSTPRGPIAVNPVVLDEHRAVLAFLSSHLSTGEQFYVYPYGPGYHFLSGHPNAAPLEGVGPHMPDFNTNEQLTKIVSALEKKEVRYVLVSFLFGRKILERHNSLLESYIRSQYHVVNTRPFFLERDAPGRQGEKVKFIPARR